MWGDVEIPKVNAYEYLGTKLTSNLNTTKHFLNRINSGKHSLQKIPVIGVFGDREVEENTVTVRRFGSNKTTSMTMEDFIVSLKSEVTSRSLPPEPNKNT